MSTCSRFLALSDAIATQTPWYRKNRSLRWRAILPALRMEADPTVVATQLLATAEQLAKGFPWYATLSSSSRLGLAAMLSSGRKIDEDGFLEELARFRVACRDAGLKNSRYFEAVSLALHQMSNSGSSFDRLTANRLRALYAAVLDAQWWLTSPADLPSLMLLLSTGRPVATLAADQQAMYAALRTGGRPWGQSLQAASFALVALGSVPDVVVSRMGALAEAFSRAGLHILSRDEDEVALLAARPEPVAELVDRVLSDRETLRGAQGAHIGRQAAFELAVTTTCIELGANSPLGSVVLGCKALCDLHEVEAQQQSAS